MPSGLMAAAPPTSIPATPTWLGCTVATQRVATRCGRGHRRPRAPRQPNSVRTGAIWPLADSGRTNFEQPVAVVLADDESPHLFSPVRQDDRLRVELPADHLHGPAYLDFDEGVQQFASELAALVPSGAALAIDEWTHALRRERSLLFANGEPPDGGKAISRAKATKTPDELACMRAGLRITEQAIAEGGPPRPRCRRPT